LARPADQHLTEDELEILASSRLSREPTYSEDDPSGFSSHLVVCEQCRSRLAASRAVLERIRVLEVKDPAPGSATCPSNEELFSLAAGLLSAEKAEGIMRHIVGCDHCGPIFRNATEDFGADLTADESSAVRQLKSGTDAWQQELATRMSSTARIDSDQLGNSASIWAWLYKRPRFTLTTALAAAVTIAIVFIGLNYLRPPSAAGLLAQAYAENRTMELRIPGARYAPVRQQRGGLDSTFDRPQALLEANALIARELKSHPDDPTWLSASARADLLEFRYQPAIANLRRALDLQPDSPALLIDLATAYYQRALASSDREVDYGTAIEYLGRALSKAPDDPVALFNRAIAEEKLNLYDPAIADWQHYLKIDPRSPWSDEARRRLDDVQQKAKTKQSSLKKPLLDPHEIPLRRGSSSLAEELNGRIEEYQHEALTAWLPKAFPSANNLQQSPDAVFSLIELSRVLQERHRDKWLQDLLSSSHHRRFPAAVAALAAAISANDKGDYSNGQVTARRARLNFQAMDSLAGELRSHAEELYSTHLLYDGPGCKKIARKMIPQLLKFSYPWLQAQVSLESATCEGINGNLGAAQSDINRGTKLAMDHGYQALFLRGLGFQADAAGLFGDTKTDFSLASKGLGIFWSNPVDLMKGYNLYTDLDTAADTLRQTHLQVAIWQQATDLIDLHPDLVQRAMAHRWLANSAYLAKMPSLATEEFSKASALFAAAPPTEATLRGKIDADVWLAELEVRQGDLNLASEALQKIQQSLGEAPGFAAQIGFYSAMAELNLQRNDPASTETSLRAAIYLSESALQSLSSDTARRQWARLTDGAYRDLVVWKLRQNEPAAALEYWEWFKGAEYRPREHSGSNPPFDFERSAALDPQQVPALAAPSAVANSLPFLRDKTVISYGVFPSGIAIWVYDERGIFSKWIQTSPEVLERYAVRFERLCSTRDSDLGALHATGRNLYDLLIEPVQTFLLPNRTLVFELDGALSRIPIEALTDHSGHYLAEHTPIMVATNVYQSQHLHPAIPFGTSTSALVVSVPSPAEKGLPPLIDSESEAQAIVDSFHSTRRLTGSAATVITIRDHLIRSALFHFVGHAVTSPEMTGLLLSETDPRTQHARLLNGESLDAESVRNLQLAVLSACETDKETESHISENGGVTEVLLRYGVPHVVASRWRIDSSQTAALMRLFYQHLALGDSVSSSLHFAQSALLSQPRFAHPYYWAAFCVRGF
jgi:CHAT domain-containing protein